MNAMRSVGAILAATVAMFISNAIIAVIYGIIIQIPLLGMILSWPVSPELYGLAACNFTGLQVGCLVCGAIAPQTDDGRQPTIAIFCGFCAVIMAFIAYGAFLDFGLLSVRFSVNTLTAVACAFMAYQYAQE